MRAPCVLAVAALLSSLSIAVPSRAATPDILITKAGCTACHAKDKKLLGPAYHDVAAKYQGDPKAAADLVAKVRSGGKGVWGTVPMPAADTRKVSDADLATIVAWILKQ